MCLGGPGGALRFLPSFDDFPVPFQTSLLAGGFGGKTVTVPLWQGPLEGVTAGDYEFWAALIERDSDPTILSNCYWAAYVTVTLKEPSVLQNLWRRAQAAFQGTGGRPS